MDRRLQAIIAIDPGRIGALVLVDENRKLVYLHNKRVASLAYGLEGWKNTYSVVKIVKEKVGGWQHDTPMTAFGLGNALGRVEGVVGLLFGIEPEDIEEIPPFDWQAFHKVAGNHAPRGAKKYQKSKAKHQAYLRKVQSLGYRVPEYAATAALMADMTARKWFKGVVWQI